MRLTSESIDQAKQVVLTNVVDIISSLEGLTRMKG
jgi:hypothetical protein